MLLSRQNGHPASARGVWSDTSSPVITHDRVIGSFLNSMRVRKTPPHSRVNMSFRYMGRVLAFVIIRPQSKMTEPSTPLLRQYTAIKREHPTALLFFRLGDFYELFFDDAVLASKELQITLTSRNKEKGIAVPMCGVPYHAAEGYISKLIRKGFKVAVCDQTEDARLAKKLVRREVTRVVTPGTADAHLSSEENNFLAALAQAGDRVGFAALDLSTGEFRATEFAGEDAAKRIEEELAQLKPKEILFASSAPLFELQGRSAATRAAVGPSQCAETPLDDWI